MKKDLPALKAKEVVAALEKAGFIIKRQSGSHVIMFSPAIKRPLTIPLHSKDLPTGTLHAIIRQANLTIDEFMEFIK